MMEKIPTGIIAIAAVLLLSVGIGLAVTDRPTSAAETWGFAFLLVILLLLSKFKRFKGFGFEAEMLGSEAG
jgi:hypothetical protein